MTVRLLRELLRNLQAFRSLYESEGVDVLSGPDGFEISLWDLEAIYLLVDELPPRQREAINLCLIENVREKDAAVQMGVSPTNPVAMYATSGLEKLVRIVNNGGVFRHLSNGNGNGTDGWIRCRFCSQEWRFSNQLDARRTIKSAHDHVCQDPKELDDATPSLRQASVA